MRCSSSILTVHLSGNHITVSVYNPETRSLYPDLYLRVPVSHKAKRSTILQVWRSSVGNVVAKLDGQVSGCTLIIPACLDESKDSCLPDNYRRYETIDRTELVPLFAKWVRIPPSRIKVISHSVAMLYGTTAYTQLSEGNIYGATIGTDFSGALVKNGIISDLNWEFKPYLSGYANNFLSSAWLQAFYNRVTGISVLNVEQLVNLQYTSNTVKTIIKMFADNLSEFMNSNCRLQPGDILFIDGDIVKAWGLLHSRLKKTLPEVTFKPVETGKKSALLGAGLLFDQ